MLDMQPSLGRQSTSTVDAEPRTSAFAPGSQIALGAEKKPIPVTFVSCDPQVSVGVDEARKSSANYIELEDDKKEAASQPAITAVVDDGLGRISSL